MLDIPSAGEFTMTGQGAFFISDQQVKIRYESVISELTDYDEENDREIYGRERMEERKLCSPFPD